MIERPNNITGGKVQQEKRKLPSNSNRGRRFLANSSTVCVFLLVDVREHLLTETV
jgi:hypothetical protein